MKNKVIFYIIIPIIFFLISFLLSSFYSSQYGFTSLTYINSNVFKETNNYNPILKGEMVSGEFTAKNNNLGIIIVDFNVARDVSEKEQDMIEFRLKEKGASTWYYQNNYSSRHIYGIQSFPFGFPIIKESKNKTYIFEITSLKGNAKNSISLQNNTNDISTNYIFEKQELFKNKQELFNFIGAKVLLSFVNPHFIDKTFYSFTLPLLYILLLMMRKKTYKKYIFSIALILIMIYSVFSSSIKEFSYLLLLIWVVFIYAFRISSSISFFLSACMILISLCIIPLHNNQLLINITSYAYVLLLIGVMQIIITEIFYKMRRVIHKKKK